MGRNIGFISTRIAGTDGVSMEASKWAIVLRQKGHACFWFAGELDRAPQRSLLVPEAHFNHEQNQWLNGQIFGRRGRTAEVTRVIHNVKSRLKAELQAFVDKFAIDMLIPQNVLAIPMHVPLAIALTELISETQLPTIAHHHDFYWERSRYLVNAVGEYLRMAFPPYLPNIEPRGFNLVVMDGYLTPTNIRAVRDIITSTELREKIVNHNYAVAQKHFSYAVLRKRLSYLVNLFFGEETIC
ncbi:MAG: hypothetical protein P8X96_13015 [Desulfobacteraceae bacterium]